MFYVWIRFLVDDISISQCFTLFSLMPHLRTLRNTTYPFPVISYNDFLYNDSVNFLDWPYYLSFDSYASPPCHGYSSHHLIFAMIGDYPSGFGDWQRRLVLLIYHINQSGKYVKCNHIYHQYSFLLVRPIHKPGTKPYIHRRSTSWHILGKGTEITIP